jgi:hypothetical protein
MMEFRNKKSKQLVKLNLAPNSLLLMVGDSRYKWLHSLPERKHDLLQNANQKYLLKLRGKRVSLTFRIVKPYNGETKTAAAAAAATMPRNELEASDF